VGEGKAGRLVGAGVGSENEDRSGFAKIVRVLL